ncbi:chemotaxis protein CheB [Prauserella muralis]|uniref:protein-glutamate methylesterase n=1 Tax=Prauserella muralis TaxID=588067 RepID=A0A2V4AY55_9PSEU|nr:chemotaxis protein CheB [Prauserella muralis]PXY26910.1 chemotaxis protein [Prauserella muralis]TWE23480.1 two-component system chemotaxis response regulator CheB [Prauserella muralis]
MAATGSTPAAPSVVVVGSSAGGVSALSRLLGALPAELGVPVIIVQHLDRRHPTLLAQVLARVSAVPVKLAEDGELARPDVAYLARPDHHLLIGPGGRLTLSHTGLVHFVRPSADVLFEAAAQAYGSRVVACVLTGTGVDGAEGIAAVKARGGVTMAQDPDTAEYPSMPTAAVASGAELVLPLEDIAPAIGELVTARTP